jgi:hypothetical protein
MCAISQRFRIARVVLATAPASSYGRLGWWSPVKSVCEVGVGHFRVRIHQNVQS